MEEAILLSYLSGQLSEEESAKVEAWVESSAENRKTLEQIYYMSMLAQRAEAYEAADVEAALAKFRTEAVSKQEPTSRYMAINKVDSSWWRRYAVAAAAFFTGLVFASSVWLGVYDTRTTYEVSTPSGQRARVILPDGTAVWLNASTQLVYESGGLLEKRKAKLKGEAYFEVKKKLFQPFVVTSQGINTEVLGTKFNVRAREAEHKVVTTLLQGSVQMYCDEQNEHAKVLKPGETMEVNADTYQTELYKYRNPEEILLWIKGDLRFKDQSLGQIMESLAKIYNIKVRFTHADLKNKRFTCMFKTDSSLEEILKTLALTRHFSYELVDDSVLIKPID